MMSVRLIVLSIVLVMVGSVSGMAADRKVTGKITGFECGDNCYLNIKTSVGEEISGLCEARTCRPWNENAAMPKAMIGRKVSATVGTGQQVDGSGNVMGEFASFKALKLLPK
jgi:hypothetical protein